MDWTRTLGLKCDQTLHHKSSSEGVCLCLSKGKVPLPGCRSPSIPREKSSCTQRLLLVQDHKGSCHKCQGHAVCISYSGSLEGWCGHLIHPEISQHPRYSRSGHSRWTLLRSSPFFAFPERISHLFAKHKQEMEFQHKTFGAMKSITLISQRVVCSPSQCGTQLRKGSTLA